MRILVLNAGSSSIKYGLYDTSNNKQVLNKHVELLTSGNKGQKSLKANENQDSEDASVSNKYESVFNELLNEIKEHYHFDAIGHRVVHGGQSFTQVVELTQENISQLRNTVSLAPQHNPVNIMGIELALSHFRDVRQFAVFDTGFHQTLPEHAYRYALPLEISDKFNIRRYGFHGISHSYVSRIAADIMTKPLNKLNFISLHLGNGASAAAIAQGRCVDTSMGMTPMAGLVMGSRCGDIDPGIILHLLQMGYSEPMLRKLLSESSGMVGLCGTNDMRIICDRVEHEDEAAILAAQIYCYQVKKYIGAYTAVLGDVDAIIFTGGVGENSSKIRALVCDGLSGLGIELDKQKNIDVTGEVSIINNSQDGKSVFVIKTNEELEIATQVSKNI